MNKKAVFSIILATLVIALFIGKVSAITESLELGDYVIDFEYDEEDVEAGETFRIEATITNEGDETKEEVLIELELDDPFDEIGDREKSIGTLEIDESKTVSFRVDVDSDTDEDFYPFEFRIEDSKDDDSDEFDIEVKSNEADLVIGNIQSLPTVISPDVEDIKLTLTIDNIGDQDAESIRARLILPQGFTPSGSFSDIANLGTIPSNSNKEVVFFIDSDEFLSSGRYQARLELSYENDGNSDIETLEFELPVKGRPQFLIEQVSVSPKPLFPGSEGKLRISIRNVGEEEGQETSIRVFENSDQPFSYNEKTNFIGNLDITESGTGIISFDVDSGDVANNYIVRVQIRTLSEGNVIVEEHSVNIKVSEPEEKGNLPYVLAGSTVVMLVFLFVLYRVKRKRTA